MQDYERITLENHERYRERRALQEAALAADGRNKKAASVIYGLLSGIMGLEAAGLFMVGEAVGGLLLMLAAALALCICVGDGR